MALELKSQLNLDRCPHCGVDSPSLMMKAQFDTKGVVVAVSRHWAAYGCQRCGGVIVASASQLNAPVREIYPKPTQVDDEVPERPKEYLRQALNSLNAPAGAIMLAASSVDSMLKAKGYSSGSLYSRIDKAAEDHLITQDMAKWAHEVRLDANDQRHADEEVSLPTQEQARKVIEFTSALAQFLFVLPARVQRGLKEAGT